MENKYESLELSTQIVIEEALNRGVAVEILDEKENFIRLRKGDKTEYIQQATKTSADPYIIPLIMENKQLTKLLLSEHSMSVPKGIEVNSLSQAIEIYPSFENMNIVIKPNTTNFGKGVFILDKSSSITEYRSSVIEALKFDSTVLIEHFIKGKEYRFLIINNEVVAVLHRIPANVIGDGLHTIEELVFIKNQSPLRGKGYKTPLEKIELGKVEIAHLQKQNMDTSTIPSNNKIIYLRENSNVSTGGDSLDYTDEIHVGYKEIALKATSIIGAKICGIDIIIEDYNTEPSKDNYSIIELNFNPALHMHNYPYRGKNRHVEKKILDLLGF
ncbi:bifunctional glutamate--cysteine ligase GshA/glutathione synthetase GshB [Alkalibaculum sp. M08DMB]|uniref:Bifunctional glutamate--cysteine ligase GshA/glutathione synthetase GshB n=1 Tax=Alkalibaculum sporogenes TaxID=2655001 RepID=A0A6A7KBB7_9FIRM|nr:bifunctional glutamate--cysteine ligase GshA/glutathione synthetase GshB [Alkalibaculum sporogenes]MPW26645.1 bifunctional glutamate--cysteine ligase GshA/glutathione synthetase GshB [Alkalibaculum sporogenes]